MKKYPHLHVYADRAVTVTDDGAVIVTYTGDWTWAVLHHDGSCWAEGTAPSHRAALRLGEAALDSVNASLARLSRAFPLAA
jgi:hypothetical protein